MLISKTYLEIIVIVIVVKRITTQTKKEHAYSKRSTILKEFPDRMQSKS